MNEEVKTHYQLKFFRIGFLIYLICSLAFMSYFLPKTQTVELVGTEVKKFDMNSKKTRDVRFVVASELITGETLMFRNEDIIWPPYFKFDSGSLSGKVMNFEENKPDSISLITYYGWRIPIFSMYPNLTEVEIVNKGHSNFPLFNIVFIILFSIFSAYLYFIISKKLKR